MRISPDISRFDLVFSIGEDGGCALLLNDAGLRDMSSFDWLTKVTLLRYVAEDGLSRPVAEDRSVLRRQDEAHIREINGAIYVNAWNEVVPTLKQTYNPYAFVMDEMSSIDIDSEQDLARAEVALAERQKERE